MGRHLLLSVSVLWLLASPARPADLTQVERAIAKEPSYQTRSPKYCLLVFGLDARTRVWLVQDGDALYVDRNGNGDLTDDGPPVRAKAEGDRYRSFAVGNLTLDGLAHKDLTVTQSKADAESVGHAAEWERVRKSGPEPWTWSVGVTAERAADDPRPLPRRVGYIANGDGTGMLLFADRPGDAPVIHFNGPFTLGLQDRRQRLIVGDRTSLAIGVGPQGIGPGTFAFIRYPNTIPADAYPEADITFPTASTGQEPIRRNYTLKDRC